MKGSLALKKAEKERYTYGWTDPRSMSFEELKADWDNAHKQPRRWVKWVELAIMILIELGVRYLL